MRRVELAVDRPAKAATIRVGERGARGVCDVALGPTFALWRLGICRPTNPLAGRPRVFAIKAPVTERLQRWADGPRQQALDGLARLEVLGSYAAQVNEALAGLRRPQALRRAIDLALWHGRLWTAELARLADVDIANA